MFPLDKTKNRIIFIFCFLIFLNIAGVIAIFDLRNQKSLEVYFLDVGQGDSMYIKTPQGHRVLIDGGPDAAVLKKIDARLPMFFRDLDLVILTHPESDHMQGLISVLERYKVKNILWTGVKKNDAGYLKWQEDVSKSKANVEIAMAGERIILDQGAYIDILNPKENLAGQELSDTNDSCVVAKLVFGSTSFLFTGDISQKGEQELVLDYPEPDILKSDVLKIAHHGSKTSSSTEFLQKVSPKNAIIEVGNNNFGHPSLETLAKLKNFGIETLTTKKSGDIEIISTGENYKILPERI